MKVYEFQGFPNPARVRIALAELEMSDAVEFISIDVPAGEHKKQPFLKKNPSATVPVLELDDGTIITECTAITEYLDHLGDGPSALTGRGAKQRAVTHMMQRRAEVRLLDAVGAYFHQATPGLGPEIEEFQSKEWGLHQKNQSIKGMKYFDSVLAEQPFIAGDEFSMADITTFAGLNFADAAQIDIPQDCTNLLAWRKKIGQRPSIEG